MITAEAGAEALSRLDWMLIQPNVIVADCGTSDIAERLQKRYPQAVIHSSEQLKTLPVGSVDMVFANLATLNMAEWRRVLRVEGLLMFTALGLSTLQQLQGICNKDELPLMLDMHDCGDMLVQAGFADPVLDVDYYTLSYHEPEKLWYELYASQMLRGDVAAEAQANLRSEEDGSYELTFEVINAHAFVPQQLGFKAGEDGVTKIPVSELLRRR